MFKLKKDQTNNAKEKEKKEGKKENILTKQIKLKPAQIVIGITTVAIVLFAFILALSSFLTQNNKKINKENVVLDPELARAMTYEQFLDGSNNVYATDENGNANENVENLVENVKFGAFFLRDINGDGYAEKLKGTCKEVGTSDTLYMELNILTKGYLKDATIDINGKNFYLQTIIPKDSEIKDNVIGDNTKQIKFNDLANGTQKILTGIVRSGNYDDIDTIIDAIGDTISNYSATDNKIILTGTYVINENEEEIQVPIKKEIDLTVDWYGETQTQFALYLANGKPQKSQRYDDLDDRIAADGTINLSFELRTQETKKALHLYKNYVEGTIPDLNGYKPIEVSTSTNNVEFSYDADNSKFTMVRTATIDENGKITSSLGYDNAYKIQVKYPVEAYTSLGTDSIEISIPVKEYYEGYNNPNQEFSNPYKSNEAKDNVMVTFVKYQGTVARVDAYIGDYIHEPYYDYIVSKRKPLRLYNEISEKEDDDNYKVYWSVSTGTTTLGEKIVLKETENGNDTNADAFIKADSTYESMEEFTKNKSIGFSNLDGFLKAEGVIKVYDDVEGNLLLTINNNNKAKYTYDSQFKFENPVKHIRIEAENYNTDSGFTAYFTKQLDDEYITKHYTKEEFDSFRYIKTNLTGYIGDSKIGTDVNDAYYAAPTSVAKIKTNKNILSTQETEENELIKITTEYSEYKNEEKWKNGIFFVKLPSEIIDFKINNITTDTSLVRIISYELIENENGNFIKINTQNENEMDFSITIDCNLTPDPRVETRTKNIELYAINESATDYYYSSEDIYDINEDENTQELINRTSTAISLISPNSLLTSQIIKAFDNKGSEVVAPQIADLKPIYGVVDNEKNSATVEIQIRNNYSSEISDVIIQGNIPYQGNKYVFKGEDLGSEFSTTMNEGGIRVPQELQNSAEIYYSENPIPTKDITYVNNGWKTANDITDWNTVKTYLIVLKNTVIASQKEYKFEYDITIPNGIEFNKTSYSHHGVYFTIHTEQGLYRTQTEPNKIGIRIAEKYNLELTKYQKDRENIVKGATYQITEVLENNELGESKAGTTNANGKLIISGLYAERIYEIKELRSPNDYELSENTVRIIGHVNQSTGELTIEKISGIVRGEINVVKPENENYIARMNVEDEVNARIKIIKTENESDIRLKGVKYRIKGEGLSQNGKLMTTDSNGEAIVKGLKIGCEYTIEEVKAAEGYYSPDGIIKFKVNENNGVYSFQMIDQEQTSEIQSLMKSANLIEENNIPVATFELQNLKIPRYKLKIEKIKQITAVEGEEQTAEKEFISGAKFKLYKEGKEIGDFITNENGQFTIEDLYLYEEEKNINQTYKIVEVCPPEGYAKTRDIEFYARNVEKEYFLTDAETGETTTEIIPELTFEETLLDNQTARDYRVDGDTITLTVEDPPLFKLTKKDGETNELIPNAKFAIFNEGNGGRPAVNSKNEIIGTKEIIDGKEYYTVATDQNGEITLDLPEGFYKAIEVQAPKKYNIDKREHRFAIGSSSEIERTYGFDWCKQLEESVNLRATTKTDNGGIVTGGSFSKKLKVGEEFLETPTTIYSNGFIVQYDSDGNIEWSTYFSSTTFNSVDALSCTNDGGLIAAGYFNESIQINDMTLSREGNGNGFIIKYNRDREIEWVKLVGKSVDTAASTIDGGAIVGGSFTNNIQIGEETFTSAGNVDGFLIKYNRNGEIEWSKIIGGTGDDYVKSVASTNYGEIIVGGYFENSIQIENEIVESDRYSDGIVIKYDSSGNLGWWRKVGTINSDNIYSVATTSKDEIIVGGRCGDNGIIIKYDINGEIVCSKLIEGNGNINISSVFEYSDGGVVVAGNYACERIQIGTLVLNNSHYNNNYNDGFIIKCNNICEPEWADTIRGQGYDYVNSAIETSDGGIAVGGYYMYGFEAGDISTYIQRYDWICNKVLTNGNSKNKM